VALNDRGSWFVFRGSPSHDRVAFFSRHEPRTTSHGFIPDARLYQIAFLATLLTVGVWLRDFSLRPEQWLLTFASGLATQVVCVRLLGLKRVGMLSAIITCFGLSILLRADNLWVHPLAAALAISAKFWLRVNGKHLYNPANLGVIAALLLPGAWVSPGQWGSDLALACWVVALGALVTRRARRWDVSWMFLACWLGFVLLRVTYLGQNWGVLFHQAQSGALLLFAFFMISDPMTIPNRQRTRLLYAVLVAAIAFFWQYVLFRPNALIWALFLATPVVPLLDRLLPAPRFQWGPATSDGNAARPRPACPDGGLRIGR
jgi:Na+-transporting NADH:ubiquinone oxidoreductase subunit NqrB